MSGRRDEHHEIQKAIVQAAQYIRSARLLYAIPNGGLRDVRVARKLKAEGVKAGIPDLCLPVARGVFHGLYLEIKTGKDDLSDAQREMMSNLIDENYYVVLVRSAQEGIEEIIHYLDIPMRRKKEN